VLRQRVIVAFIFGPIVLLAAYAGGEWFLALVTIAALLATYELVLMARRAGHQPSLVLSLVVVAALVVGAHYPTAGLLWPTVTLAVMLAFGWQIFRPEAQRSLTDWALTLASGLYIGMLAGYLVALRNLPQGLAWTLWMFFATWANDTAAYFVGKGMGRHLFAPHVSPHKTWEGSIGGWVFCALVSAGMGISLGQPLVLSLGLGVVLGPMATLGDLAVSFLKRRVGVKDTSSLIPGHGGMLDRMDSLLFTAVVVYYYAVWIIR